MAGKQGGGVGGAAIRHAARADQMNRELVVGGAAGYPVPAYIGLPVIAGFAVAVVVLVWSLVAFALWSVLV